MKSCGDALERVQSKKEGKGEEGKCEGCKEGCLQDTPNSLFRNREG